MIVPQFIDTELKFWLRHPVFQVGLYASTSSMFPTSISEVVRNQNQYQLK